ncbi:UDP-N-acetylmuramate dehydrogenase [Helicobacter sp. 'CLO3_human']|nr:UDP-N-acetylmuramate dehydrogenase [Helicobacter sp. 'CLO3_human']
MIDFSRYLSLKIGSILPVSIIDDYAYDKNLRIIGFGYNLLVSPQAKNLAILSDRFDYIKEGLGFIEIGASTRSTKAYKYFLDNDLGGLEFIGSLPGSIGGLVKMNAGMKEFEIKNTLDSVCIDGDWISIEDLDFSYRRTSINGVIFAARFKKIKGFNQKLLDLFSQMRKVQPKTLSCGSCFKNPVGDYAGRLIEAVGMKGFYINGVGFSDKHANFLVNVSRGIADYDSAIKVIELANKKVFDNFGIEMEKEVIILE